MGSYVYSESNTIYNGVCELGLRVVVVVWERQC